MNSPERFEVDKTAVQSDWSWPGLGLWNLYLLIKLAMF